jgi:hypothetical protein
MNNAAKNTDEYIAALPAWQAQKLTEFRDLVHDASGDISEEIKWGVPAFMYKSKVTFTMAAFKSHVKYNFIQNGAALNDARGLFNNGLESAKSRSIDSTEGQSIDRSALKDLIKQAIEKFE